MKKILTGLIIAVPLFSLSQIAKTSTSTYWQQKVKYIIDVDVDAVTNRFSGKEKLQYWNNSPDTLTKVFYHLYWNAFQPNSMMDIRSRELGKTVLGTDREGNPVYDWDDRVKDRIQHLQPNEIGYDSAAYVKLNGVAQKLISAGTRSCS